jgi:hypothetical protein
MQQWAVNILFYCILTQHVSGTLAPIIRSTGKSIYSHRYRVYTDKIEVVEGKTVKNITLNLRLSPASVAESFYPSVSFCPIHNTYLLFTKENWFVFVLENMSVCSKVEFFLFQFIEIYDLICKD